MKILPTKHAPRWIVSGIDLVVSFCCLYVAALLRFEFFIPRNEWEVWLNFLPVFIIVRFTSNLLFRTSAGIIRHTGLADARRIILANSSASFVFIFANLTSAFVGDGTYWIPFSILGMEWVLSNTAMISSRWLVKWLYLQNRRLPGIQTQIAIFGAGEAGLIAKQAIDRELGDSSMKVVVFIDDDKNKVGKKIEGVDIISAEEANSLFQNGRIDRLILSIQNLVPERRRQIVDQALKHGVRPLDVPPVDRWINGELSFGQIRELNIEDLLGRAPIQLDEAHSKDILGQRIVITGAAGSIGSELVRQVLSHKPASLLAIDQAETPMHDLHLELARLGLTDRVELQLGDVRDANQLLETLVQFRPDIVFHAAAYKHVPLMEKQPWQSFETNAMGTLNTVRAAQAAKSKKFVFISTDKAVNPTSIMGATKRLAELLLLHECASSQMQCVITRFGNVLGSNGSVIPLFRRQIEAGGPITVTDEDVTRYFMTIPEAVSLVLEAAYMGEKDDVFVFDMGESIKIIDLARKMIALAGMEEGKDIKLAITGLRPGEKLHEELLSERESLLPTHHEKIMRASTPPSLSAEKLEIIQDLAKRRGDHRQTLEVLKSFITEFQTEHSLLSNR